MDGCFILHGYPYDKEARRITNISIEVPKYGPSSNHPGPKKNYTLQTLNPKPLTRSMDPLLIMQDPKRTTFFKKFSGQRPEQALGLSG